MPLAQTIGLQQLSEYFHLPINEVAKELGVCATVLKKICRRNGIPRWPHRKIKSLDKMIRTLEATVAKKPEDEDRILQEIATLYNKKMYLMKNPNVLVKTSKGTGSSKFKTSITKFHKATTSQSSPSTSTSTSPSPSPSSQTSEQGTNATTQSQNKIDTQEEAATSLLSVFASLQNKLQDQPNKGSSASASTSSSTPLPVICSPESMGFALANFGAPPPPPSTPAQVLFSLQLPKLAMPDDWHSASPQKKLATLEPDFSSPPRPSNGNPNFPVSSPRAAPMQELPHTPNLPAMNNNASISSIINNNILMNNLNLISQITNSNPTPSSAALPSWFFQDLQQYSNPYASSTPSSASPSLPLIAPQHSMALFPSPHMDLSSTLNANSASFPLFAGVTSTPYSIFQAGENNHAFRPVKGNP